MESTNQYFTTPVDHFFLLGARGTNSYGSGVLVTCSLKVS